MWMNGEVLITNDFGDYAFLSKEEFESFATGKLRKGTELYHLLQSRGFVSNQLPEVFVSEQINNLRRLKGYLFSSTALHIFAVTNQCNQNCVYCQAKVPSSTLNGVMDLETGKKAIEVAMQSPSKYLTFEFQGGEPLLNFDVVLGMVEHSKELNASFRKEIKYTIVTNLIALTDEKLQALMDNDISICTSLDGCEIVHNHNRKLRSGEGTYLRVKDTINRVKAAGKQIGAIETTTKFSLDYPKEIVDEYVNCGLNGIFLRSLTPLGFAKSFWDEVGYSADDYMTFYRTAFEHIIEINKSGKCFPELHATYFLRKILHGESDNYMELRSPCGAGIGQMSYYYNGNVYTCDEGRMMGEAGDDTFLLGNVHLNTYDDLINNRTCKATCAASVVESLPKCCDCAYHPYCGVCPVVAYSSDGDIFPKGPFDYRCKIYKGMLDILFEYLQKDDTEIQSILNGWLED
jgi:His-Xaa-Ser system radical SAM maturase HxsB